MFGKGIKVLDQSPGKLPPIEELTWREQEVLALLAQRLTNREIAAQLHLAETTVKDYVSRILGKLGVKNRRQAVERAMELGLLAAAAAPALPAKPDLPAEITPFIGRQKELDEIRAHLGGTRLLTLTGPGGIGKTRLALKAASEAAKHFEEGSHFVNLAPLQSPDRLIQAVAEALNFPLSTQKDPQVQLLHFLRDKQLLLLLDNFEHLLAGAAIVQQLLRAAPSLRILATSRERLNLQSETVLQVGALEIPASESASDLLENEAVAVFMQNARKVRPGYQPSLPDLEDIAAICRLVDGMPLAIELAAGWLHILAVKEITRELEGGLDFLSSDLRDAPERHRSMRAVFDHSWALMNPEQQDVVRWLSVFKGGFTRQAAQVVAGASLSVLGGLVNKSIIRYRQGAGRFEMHELLRQYAQEKLEADPKAAFSAHQAQAAYFAELMVQQWGHLRQDQQVAALRVIEDDLENIRTAWRIYLDQGDASGLGKFINPFWLVYWVRGWNFAAARLFGEVVDRFKEAAGEAEQVLRARAMAQRAFFLAWLGLADQGYLLGEASLEILNQWPDQVGLYFAYHSLTLVTYYLDLFAEAQEATQAVLEISQALEDPWLQALALAVAGTTTFHDRNYAESRRLSESGLQLSLEIGDLVTRWLSLMTLGHLAVIEQDWFRAKNYFQRGLDAAEKIGFRWGAGNSIKYLGRVALVEGDLPTAEAFLRQSLGISYDMGHDRDIANHIYEFARLRSAQGRSAEALQLLVLVGQLPASEQSRLGRGSIRDRAKERSVELEPEFSPQTLAELVGQARRLDVDEVVVALLHSEGDG